MVRITSLCIIGYICKTKKNLLNLKNNGVPAQGFGLDEKSKEQQQRTLARTRWITTRLFRTLYSTYHIISLLVASILYTFYRKPEQISFRGVAAEPLVRRVFLKF
jgi:hypothetical protein